VPSTGWRRWITDHAGHPPAPEHLPAVSYLKAAEYQDGHAGYSDPPTSSMFSWNRPDFRPYLLDPATGEPMR
jgi:hypothetical protein